MTKTPQKHAEQADKPMEEGEMGSGESLMDALDRYCSNTKGHFNDEGFIVLDTPFIRLLKKQKGGGEQ